MFFSLVQTLVCVLLIQGGIYALHLTGNNGGGSSSSSIGSSSNNGLNNNNNGGSNLPLTGGIIGNSNGLANYPQNGGGNSHMMHVLAGGGQMQHMQHKQPIHLPKHPQDDPSQIAEKLADIAQMDRERFMLLDLAKQTAAAAAAAHAAASTGHHGRPIITGRIQMTPAEDVESSSSAINDYAGVMLQQPQRNFMFGSVVKQPPRQGDDYDDDVGEEFDGGGRFEARRRPIKYEYGRIVQPADREFDPQNMDLDGFMELEVAEPDVDDMIPDLDGYQYLDELLADQNKPWPDETFPAGYGHHRFPENPYRTLEELEANQPQALQELFDKEREQHDAPESQVGHKEILPKTRSGGGSGYNIRLQQKWQRKRNQQQQQQQQHQQLSLQRNIFGGHRKHHFKNLQQPKFSLANSEATATKHIGKNAANTVSSSSVNDATAIKTTSQQQKQSQQSQQQQQSQSNNNQADDNKSATASTSSSSASLASTAINNNGRTVDAAAREHLQQSNHKRSGAITAAGGYGSGLQPPPVTHSIASQLMLRTARGQRQYDVPQIECPTAMDGMERFACPTPDLQGRYRCIDDHVLCDGFIDCPEGEDEDRRSCMFYKTTKAHLDVLADALLRWARGR